MNGYKAFWKNKTCEVHADTSFSAQEKAIAEFKRVSGRRTVKPYDVTVILCEKDGESVTHVAVD